MKHHHQIGKEAVHKISIHTLAEMLDTAKGGLNQITDRAEQQWSGGVVGVSFYLPRTPNKLLRDIVVSLSRSAITRAKL